MEKSINIDLPINSDILWIWYYFCFKDIGEVNYFLGAEVKKNKSEVGLFLSQRKYILELIQKAGLSYAKPISNPISTATSSSIYGGSPFDQAKLFWSLIEGLQ